ncbi:MAG: PorT family protein [Bacteroidia bacterium]|nr:PorT family protein [Bacteroidia bacterium]
MKTFRTIGVALLFMSWAWAQQGSLKVGVALLPQSTWLLNQDDSDAGPELDYVTTWGFAGGLTAAYNLTDYLGVGLDILYSSQGQKYKGTTSGTNWTSRTQLNYLKLPFLLRFNSDPNSPVQFSFFVGPQLNYLLSYRDKIEATTSFGTATGEISGTTYTTTISGGGLTVTDSEKLTAPAYKSLTFGAALGLGVGFQLTDELSLSVHFRGDYSFGDVENKDCKVDHTTHGGAQEPFWEVKPKYGASSSPTPAGYKRPATSAITGGLMLGLTYTLPLR